MPTAFQVYFVSLAEGPSKANCLLRKRFQESDGFGTDLQQVEIVLQTGGALTFDLHRQRGQLSGALLELRGALRVGGDDRGHRSLLSQRRVPGPAALRRSFPRIRTTAPVAWGASSSALITRKGPEKWSAQDRQPTNSLPVSPGYFLSGGAGLRKRQLRRRGQFWLLSGSPAVDNHRRRRQERFRKRAVATAT